MHSIYICYVFIRNVCYPANELLMHKAPLCVQEFTHLPYILVFNYFAGRDHPVSSKVLGLITYSRVYIINITICFLMRN